MIEEYLLSLKEKLDNPNNFIIKDGHKLWVCGQNDEGYGQTRLGTHKRDKIYKIHRLSLCFKENLSYFGDFLACHTENCVGNKSCYEPAHLYAGNHLSNRQDYAKTITHCVNGHEYTSSNTEYNNKEDKTGRYCITCKNESSKAFRDKNKEVIKERYKDKRKEYSKTYRKNKKLNELLEKV
jgi:hypothetical protein